MTNTWLTAGAPPLSVTCTVNVEVPEPQGVPTIVAVVLVDDVFSFKQFGSEPTGTEYV
jgi:hypothetical protein